jgi:hypothetical protein
MRFLNNMTGRERTIFYVTAAIVLAAGVYFGYVERVIERYQAATEELAAETARLEQQRSTLKEGPEVNRRFAEIEGTLPKPHEGKDPAMVFSEQMEELFRNLGLPTPEFGRSGDTAIPSVDGFSYQWIPILKIEGDLDIVTKLLKNLAVRKLKIRSLNIEVVPGTKSLRVSVEPAQVIRDEDIGRVRTKPKRSTTTTTDEEL